MGRITYYIIRLVYLFITYCLFIIVVFIQVFRDAAKEHIDKRANSAAAYLSDQVTSMFSRDYLNAGGRWDMEGLRMHMAAVMGPDSDIVNKMKGMNVGWKCQFKYSN